MRCRPVAVAWTSPWRGLPVTSVSAIPIPAAFPFLRRMDLLAPGAPPRFQSGPRPGDRRSPPGDKVPLLVAAAGPCDSIARWIRGVGRVL